MFAAAFAAGALLAAPASGQAAQTFGSNLTSAADEDIPCVAPGCSVWNTSLPAAQTANSVFAPITGIVTSFTLKKNSGNWPFLHLRVAIPLAGNGGVPWRGGPRSTPPDPLPTNTAGTQTLPTHLAVTAGDLVALGHSGGDMHNGHFLASSFGRGTTGGPLPADGSQTNTTAVNGVEVLVQYSVEPDADGDGFGDETEDKCAGQKGPNAGCPAAKKKCKKKKRKGKKSAARAKKKCKKRKKKK